MAQADFHPDEWKVRLELAATYRIFDMLGWTEMIYNHITVRLPHSVMGVNKHFLINPFGLLYSEVTASNLVKVDTQGAIVHPSAYPVNPAGVTLHTSLHNNLPEAHCVMHTHTTTGSAVASTASGLAQNNFYSAQLHGDVAYHDFEGITLQADETPRLLRNIGDKHLVILRNHGLLAWGATLPMTFVRLWTLQRACDVQCMQAALGPAIDIPEAVAIRASQQTLEFDAQFGAGQDVLDAMIRRVDKYNSGYAQ